MKVTDQQNKILKSRAGVKRIIACAGSGKTYTLISNIADILQKNLCRPDEILAITFTRNAAENMRQKVKETAGKNIDYESINIYTFNSFGNMIVSENSFLMGYGKDYRLISISKSWNILYSIVKEAGLKNVKVGRDTGKFIEDVLRYIWNLKSNLVSVKELIKYHKSSEHLLRDYKSRALQKEEMEIAGLQEELALIYENYERIKHGNNFIDYHDHVFLPYRLLAENKSIADRYATRYRYIFIDEFQDTDVAQGYLISLIYRPDYNSITVVGDDDQGIYSFRGACVENILNFDTWDIFRKHSVENFYLTVNFRSGENIVKMIDKIINGNRLRFEKALKPEYSGKYSDVFFGFYQTHEQEAARIADCIKNLLSAGLKLKDIAILSRRKRFRYIAEVLDKNNLRYELISSTGFFYEPEILFLISWLMMIHDTRNEIYLLNLLKSRKYNISDRDIFFLKNCSPDEGRFLSPKEAGENNLMDSLLGFKKNTYLGNQAKKRIAGFLKELDNYISKSVFLKLSELISFIYENSGLADELKSGFDKTLKVKIRNIETLIKISSDFEWVQTESNLENFITYLKDVAKTDEEDPDNIELSGSNSIKIMSIHASKGLEFDAVFMPMLWHNDYSGRSSSGKFKIPSILRKDHKVYKNKGNFASKQKFDEEVRKLNLEEERRIFYVGCSRAKRFLFLSCSDFENERELKKDLQKPREILPFLAEILKSGNLKVLDNNSLSYLEQNGYMKNGTELIDFDGYIQRLFDTKEHIRFPENKRQKSFSDFNKKNSMQVQKNTAEFIEKLSLKCLKIKDKNTEGPFKDSRISGFPGNYSKNPGSYNKRNFSLSELLTYIDCPRYYKFRHIYEIPEPVKSDIAQGDEVHKHLKILTSAEFFSILKNEYPENAGLDFSGSAESFKSTEGARNISAYIDVFKNSSLLDCSGLSRVLLEQLFYWNLTDYTVGCKIDRLDFKKDKTIRIIDYKVSGLKNNNVNDSYLNQLKAYSAVACEIFNTALNKILGTLLFLKDGEILDYSFTEKEIKYLKESLLEAIHNINRRQFNGRTSGNCKKSCSYHGLCKKYGKC